MSAKSLNLKNPVLIAVVLVLLAAVTVLNVRTFGSKKHRSGTSVARAQAYPVLPGDLSELVRRASEDLRSKPVGADPAETLPVSPERDPFFAVHTPIAGNHVRVARHGKKPSKRRKSLPECGAVLLGGEFPMALIGGRTYQENDEVSGFKVLTITASGVVLGDKFGHTRTLDVGNGQRSGSFTVSVGDEGSLTQVHEERKEP